MTAGHEADIAIGQLEAAVERRQHEMNLTRRDLITVGPADDAAFAGTRMQRQVYEALIEAQQCDARALLEPSGRVAVNLRDARPFRRYLILRCHGDLTHRRAHCNPTC